MVCCSACGAQIAQGSSFCSGCGRPITAFAVPIAPKKNHTGLILCLLAFITIVGGFVVFNLVAAGPELSAGAVVASPPRDECKSNAFAYMLAVKEGKAVAAGFWKPGTHPATLYNVREFDEIKSGNYLLPSGKPYAVPRRYVQYAVDSSTEGGIPIKKRWNVVMEPSSKNYGKYDCAIVDLKAAE